ncbi:MAG: hypothetical protein HYZ17_06060 [Betaproteobacteria bacterium]|nr:hypothetical protein [Xanthomonadales bacterium]MBI3148063.1 hypothetical protein [Betaproteobacteria bacterium]
MSEYADPRKAIDLSAERVQALQQQAVRQYQPVVDDILRTRSSDSQHIEQTLDGLLDFCSSEHVLHPCAVFREDAGRITPTASFGV